MANKKKSEKTPKDICANCGKIITGERYILPGTYSMCKPVCPQ
jgi:hypothetical protein